MASLSCRPGLDRVVLLRCRCESWRGLGVGLGEGRSVPVSDSESALSQPQHLERALTLLGLGRLRSREPQSFPQVHLATQRLTPRSNDPRTP